MLSLYRQKRVLSLYKSGMSIRNINRTTGHSRNTIRKVIDNAKTFKYRSLSRPSKLDKFKKDIKNDYFIEGVSRVEIFRKITIDGFDGSFSILSKYLTKQKKKMKSNQRANIKRGVTRKKEQIEWVFNIVQNKTTQNEIARHLSDSLDAESIEKLLKYARSEHLRYRNRAISILAYHNKISVNSISNILGCQKNTVRSYVNKYKECGIAQLFNLKRKEFKKFEEPEYIEIVFKILHSPPLDYGFNRTSWRMKDLKESMKQEGFPLSEQYIRKIIKNAGYRFLKAKKTLTSNDPQYREKLSQITNILSNLQPDEKFFSIDEYGPFAIKIKSGRSWMPKNQQKHVPQWQRSKGCLILTAAIELSTNQVTHFFSTKKNTDEMIKLLNLLLEKYKGEKRIYFSWDAASWHASKKLYKKIEAVNNKSSRLSYETPYVELAPLPACAQFLNVIESIFSGMARAIIHNSNYECIEDCKLAIDRYFEGRNQYFLKNPKRAGNKIWGKEITKAEFNESHNCKNPCYR